MTRAVVEALEPRLLYSIDPLAGALAADALTAQSGGAALQSQVAAAAASTAAAGTEIVFVDAGVQNAQQLIADLQAQQTAGRAIEVVRIGADEDGIAAISQALAQRQDLSAVHVLSHGEAGQLQLGRSVLNESTLFTRAADIAAWGRAMTAQADLLLYGCDVAATPGGARFVDDLAALTGADVAASNDATGSALLGADWQLEYQDGSIDAAPLLTWAAQAAWQGTLATTVTFQQGVGTYTGTQDTTLSSAAPSTNYGSSPTLSVGSNGNTLNTLIRFDALFGGSAGQIPVGATITDVSLSFTLNSASLNLFGFPINLYEMLAPWTESSTWNSMTNGVQFNGVEAASSPDQAMPISLSSTQTFSSAAMIATVQDWANGATNYGWITSETSGSNSYSVYSSEYGTVASRPVLSVTYTTTPPALDLDANNSSGASGNNFSTSFTEGGGAVKVADTDATLTDTDSNLASMTVTIGNLLDGSAESLAATVGSTGISASYSAGVLTLSGTSSAANYQQVLRTITYNNSSQAPSTTSRSIVFSVTDADGNTATATTTLAVSAVNTAPTATITPTSYSATEQTSLALQGTGLSVADADAGSSSVQATLSVASGALTAAAGSSGVTLGGSGTSTVTLTGTLAQINSFLAGTGGATLSYLNSSDTPAATDTLTLSVNDQGNTGSGGAKTSSDTAIIDIAAVNDAPVATITPTGYSVTEQATLTLHGTGLSISDVDAGSASVRATVSVVSGTLTASAGSTGVSISGSGSNSITLTGTLTQINNLLAGSGSATLRYVLNSDAPPATDMLTLSVDDQGNTGSGGAKTASDTATITINAVNDAPTATIVASSYSATEQTRLTLSGTGLSISDAEAANNTVRAIVAVGAGTLNASAGSTGASVSGSGSGSVTLTGTLAQINNLLAGTGGATLSFVLNSDTPPALTTLTLTVSDLGNSGSGGVLTDTDTATINITAVNKTNSLWLSSNSSSPVWNGLTSMDTNAVEQLGGPTLTLGAGTTSGSFWQAFTTGGGGSLDDLVRVAHTVTLANATLQRGDLLFTTASNATLVGHNSVSASANDIVLFHPDSPNDYSAGTFTVLVQGLGPTGAGSGGGGPNVVGLALVEQDTTLGDASLTAGSLLYSMGSGGGNTIYLFTPDGGTSGGYLTGSVDALITGSQIGINQKIMGLELVAADTPLGGLTLQQGSLLLSLNGSATVGSNSLAVEAQDVFSLHPTLTSLNGSAAATASIVVQGASLNMSGSVVDGLAINFDAAPTITSNGGGSTASVSVAENTTSVTTVVGADPDTGTTLSYAITGGADASFFSINSSTGALRFITSRNFESPADGNGDNIYVVTVTVSDGTYSASQTIAAQITDANEAPTIISNGGAAWAFLDMTEGFTAVTQVQATDPDAGATLSYSIVGGLDAAAFVIDASTGMLSFASAPSAASPTDSNGDNAYLVQVQASDGTLHDTQNVLVSVASNTNPPAVHSVPPAQTVAEDTVLHINGMSLSYAGVSSSLTVKLGVTQGTLTVNTGVTAGVPAGSITGNGSAAVYLTGSVAEINATLDNAGSGVLYQGVADYNGADTLTFISDAGGGATATSLINITITPVNDAPTQVLALAAQSATQGQPYSYTVPGGSFGDVDGDTLAYSATLSGGAALPGWLSFDAGTRTFSGTPGAADLATLTVVVTASDGNGGQASGQFTLPVNNVNDAPVLAQTLSDQVGTQGQALGFTVPSNTFTDPDSGVGDTLHYSATLSSGMPLPSWLTFDAGTRAFSGTPGAADVGSLAIRVTATDDSAAYASTTFTLTIGNINDAPVQAQTLAAQNATQGQVFSYTVSGSAFTDADSYLGDTLHYSAALSSGAALPSWLSFNAGTRAFSGTPGAGDVATYVIRVTAADDSGASTSGDFTLAVANVNDAPVLSVPWADQSGTQGQPVNFTVPPGSFTDADTYLGDSLHYSATLTSGAALPGWLSVDSASGNFTGTPGAGDVGAYAIRVTARDDAGAGATHDFTLTIANVNDAPVLAQTPADQSGTQDQALSFTLPGNLFTDADGSLGDTLSYSATLASGAALPGWLSFNAATGNFSGTPGWAEVGSYLIRITATDGQSATATGDFTLTVANVSDAPTGADAHRVINEDSPYTFALSDFGFADAHDVVADSFTGVRIAALPAAGSLTLNGTAVQTGDVVSAADITAGHLVFAPAANASGTGYAALQFQVQDSGTTGLNQDATARQFSFDVTAVNDTPVITANQLTVDTGAMATPQITVSDPDDAAAALQISVLNLQGGHFELTSAPGTAVTTFLYTDVQADTVRFVHDGSAFAPAYDLRVSDAASAASQSSAQVQFQGPLLVAVLPAPSTTTTTIDSSSSTGSSGTDNSGGGGSSTPTTTPAKAGAESAVAGAAAMPLLPGTPFAPEAGGGSSADRGLGSGVEGGLGGLTGAGESWGWGGVGGMRFAIGMTLNPAREDMRFDAVTDVQATAFEVNTLVAAPLDQLAHNGAFQRDFDSLRQAVQDEGGRQSVSYATGMAMTSGLSVGYVIWLIRGGTLLGTMLSAMPAWQMVDPLPVLARAGRSRGESRADGADGRVEQLFDDEAGDEAAGEETAPTPGPAHDAARAQAAAAGSHHQQPGGPR